jgi:YbbR domain-containing protein
MKNVNLQIFSVLVAILLSLFVNSETNSSVMGFVVPIEIKNVPFGKTVLLQSSTQVQVTVKGPSFLISQVVSSRPNFKVKVPEDVKNKFEATLNPSDLALPPYVQVLSIEPGEVALTFDDIIQKELPVVVPKIGNLKGNLRLEETVINPPTVTIIGPESEIKDLTSIETYPVDLREIESDYQQDINLRMPSRLSDLSYHQVNVHLKIATQQKEVKWNKLPVEIRAPAGEHFTVTPATVNIEVTGAVDILSKLSPRQIVPFVHIVEGAENGSTTQVEVDLPDGISLVQVDPQQVKVVKE